MLRKPSDWFRYLISLISTPHRHSRLTGIIIEQEYVHHIYTDNSSNSSSSSHSLSLLSCLPDFSQAPIDMTIVRISE